MGIRINTMYNIDLWVVKKFEKVSENLILVNIMIESDLLNLDSRPVHCRYEFGDFPPLDISLDSETGLIKEITIFINKENVRCGCIPENIDLTNLQGYPSANMEFLKKHEYYYDEVCEMEIYLFDTTLRVCRMDRTIYKKLVVNEELTILLDEENKFVGLSINHLSIENIELFK